MGAADGPAHGAESADAGHRAAGRRAAGYRPAGRRATGPGRPGAEPRAAGPAAPAPNLTPPAAAAPAASPPPRPGAALPPLDIRALLHPAEHSRLMIALSAAAIVFGVAAMAVYAFSGWQELAVYAGVLALAGFLLWFFLQVYRSRLLGGAVRVSETTLPELQAVFDEVRARLDYRKHVDVYVKDKVDGGSLMTSYLGTRLIEIEGGLVADLLADGHQAELTYLIGRHIGQLKARHQRLTPIFIAISAIDSVKFLQPFLAPYLRATAKSGDQIGAACCGDIGATAATMNRLLAGKELGPQLVINGVLDQAAVVRRRWLPRLAQLFMSLPHATNRYLNLLAFFARVAPDEINAWRATLDRDTARRLNAALDSSPNRRPPRRHPSVLATLLALLVTGGVLAASGWLIFGHLAGARAADTASQELLSHVPAGFAATCVPVSVPADDAAQGVDARVECQPAALGSGGSVVYLHYPNAVIDAGHVRQGGPGGADGQLLARTRPEHLHAGVPDGRPFRLRGRFRPVRSRLDLRRPGYPQRRHQRRRHALGPVPVVVAGWHGATLRDPNPSERGF